MRPVMRSVAMWPVAEDPVTPRAEAGAEAGRMLGICNVCGYCNGLCDVFEAARRRQALADRDLAHLANLCHGCRGCLYACQYAPPHAFGVNVPRALARVRRQCYADYVWPRALRGLLTRPRATAAAVAGISIGLMVAILLVTLPGEILFAEHRGEGAFYRVVPWWGMLPIGVLPLGWSALALGLGLRRYWRDTGSGVSVGPPVIRRALRDAVTLRNLDGGGPGCNDLDDRPSRWRRRLHQVLVAGLALTFGATVAAALLHHLAGWQAPYPPFSLPVVLGTLGGIAIVIAAVGLLGLKRRADPFATLPEARADDEALLGLLLLVAVTGLVLLLGRATAAMGLLLAIHLGSVLALFLLLPYSKFVHAGYRFAALIIEAGEHLERDGARIGSADLAGAPAAPPGSPDVQGDAGAAVRRTESGAGE